MDLLEAQWLSELEADHDSSLINEWQMKLINNSVNNLDFNHHLCESNSADPSSSSESIQESSPDGTAKSAKEIKNNDFRSSYSSTQKASQKVFPSASPNIISFGDCNSAKSSGNHNLYRKRKCNIKAEADMMSPHGELNFSTQISPSSVQQFCETMEYGEPIKKGCNRTPLQAQDHVLAERKRGERLTERFVSLSTMVPGLKKLDKASVLLGAIKYLEQLQERIKMLEDEKRKQEESVNISSISKRPRISCSDEISSSGEISDDSTFDQSSSEIEVRTSDTNVLVRVYCEKRSGIIKEILSEIEKLHLGIISSSVIPFGSATLNITVIAQMDREVSLRAQSIANSLRTAIQKLVGEDRQKPC